ncbi:MAG: helix-turn-helix transcriptional regulator with aminotransferase domain, GntR family, partial [Armatimonadetes bacterium]|nr:helix-turn-helix transcriptional regulator with aminotransferase domain, GntR family [Armatimonadota bacterium]
MQHAAADENASLYRRVAGQIIRLIEEGTFPTGHRIPSVRQLSTQQAVSITTVLEAYRLLESDGWIEARPQSGYFVSPRFTERPAEPEASTPLPDPTRVSIGELSLRILRDMGDTHLVQLGAAVPNPAFLPAEKLNRIYHSIARELGGEALSYDVPPGCKALRLQIARRMLDAGCEVKPEEIITTSGCQEAMVLCLRAVCRPGDTVAIESPMYYGVLQALEALGLRALELPTHPRHGISLGALRYAIGQHPIGAVLISNFNNPTGACLPDDGRRELAELLADRNIPLIEDDIYGDLAHEAPRPRAVKAWDRKGLVLFCSSFSKTLAPGYRVGWVVPGRFFRELEHLKFFSNLVTATLPQLTIAEFLQSGSYERYLRRLRPLYARQTGLFAQAVGRAFPAGSRVTRPEGGFVAWVELPPNVDSLELYRQALAAGITFAPGPIFTAGSGYRNFIRLNAATWSPEVEAAI